MTGPATLHIALLAAGSSSRMRGRDKLLEEVDGMPLLRLAATRARATGCSVIVTLPEADRPHAAARGAALDGLDVQRIAVADAASGMSASFRALAAHVTGPLLVMLADMPEIDGACLARLIEAHAGMPDRVVRATASDGTPGQPVVFPARLVPAMADLAGDAGARALLRQEDVHGVALPGNAALTDLDTPEAWAAWRGARPGGTLSR